MKKQLMIRCNTESFFTSIWMEMTAYDNEVTLMFENGNQAIWFCAAPKEMRKALETALEMLDQLTNQG